MSTRRFEHATDVTLALANSAFFGFESAIFASFRPSFELFAGRGIQRAKKLELRKIYLDAPKDQVRYHDDDLIPLLSVKSDIHRVPLFKLEVLHLSSQFVLKLVEVRTTACLAPIDPRIHSFS